MPAGRHDDELDDSRHDLNRNKLPAAEEHDAHNILESVKEQEAQFEQLTRELEAERQSVATQLLKYKFGSETASLSSISSTDESFHWKPPPHDARFDEESETDSKVSGSQLVDSCLRVLQERGVTDTRERTTDHLPPVTMSHVVSQTTVHTTTVTSRKTDGVVGRSPDYDPYGGQPYQPNHRDSPPTPARSTPLYNDGHYGNGGPSDGPGYHSQQDSMNNSYQLNDSRYGNGPSNRYQAPEGTGSIPDHYDSFDHQFQYRDQESLPNKGPEPRYGALPPNQHSPNSPRYDPQQYASEDPYSRGQEADRPPLHLDDSYNQPSVTGSYRETGPPGGYRDTGPPSVTGSYRDTGPPSVTGSFRDGAPQQNPPSVTGSYRDVSPRDDPKLPPGHNGYRGDRDNYSDPYHHGNEAPRYGDYPGDVPYSDDQYSDSNRPYPEDRARPGYGRQGSLGSPRSDGSFPGLPHVTADGRYPDDRSQRTDSPSLRSGVGGQALDSPRLHPDYRQGGGQKSPTDPRDPRYQHSPRLAPDSIHSSQPDLGRNSPARPYGDPDRPYRDLNRPYGDPDRPYDSQRPYGDSDRPYGDPDRPYGDADRPYGDSDRPHMHPGRPQDDPDGPYNDPDRPYDPNRSYNDPGRPYNDPERPYNDPMGSGPLHGQEAPVFQRPLGGADDMEPPYQRSTQSLEHPAFPRDSKWRNPELSEVIEFLSHSNDSIKANAAAYLQHLCYRDDNTKAKTRAMGGIPALVALVSNPVPEVHRSACGALRNLSYGKSNDENKRDIRKAQGIPALVRLLRTSRDNNVRELVTGILWNLSSCQDLKRVIVDEGLKTIVDTVVMPCYQTDPSRLPLTREIYCSVVYRNASGILRNVSSDGAEARIKMRLCGDLVEALLHIVRTAIAQGDIDNKAVENTVCVLRNLSYACQEVQDSEYLKRRANAKPNSKDSANKSKSDKKTSSGDSVGCFGSSGSSSKKKKDSSKHPPAAQNTYTGVTNTPRGQELLWHESVVLVYRPLLRDCTNPETLEAAAGAIQNLAACEWQPAENFRAAFRKEKGLPVVVELLNIEADRVVCSAAMALRNLALDTRNKELVGKYAMEELVKKLPALPNMPPDQSSLYPVSNDTLCAVLATLFEVIKNNFEFASSLMKQDGLERLVYMVHKSPPNKFSPKAIKFGSSVLQKMWTYSDLHESYKKRGLTQADFLAKPKVMGKSPPPSAENTLHRPRMDQSGPTLAGYNENTLPNVMRQPNHNNYMEDPYGSRDRMPSEQIPLRNMGPSQPGYNDPRSYDRLAPNRADESFRGNESFRDQYPGDINPYQDPRTLDQDQRNDPYQEREPPGVDPYEDRDRRGGDPYDDRDPRGADPYRDPRADPYGDPRSAPDPYADRDPRGDPYSDRDPRGDPYADRDPNFGDQYSDQAQRIGDEYSDHSSRPDPYGRPYDDQDQRVVDPYGDHRNEPYIDRDPANNRYGDDKPDLYRDDQFEVHSNDYRPQGGASAYPNSAKHSDPEPLYAKVNKTGPRRDKVEDGAGPGGADSWV